MAKVIVFEKGAILCDNQICDPLSLATEGADCGDCPIMRLCSMWDDMRFGDYGC